MPPDITIDPVADERLVLRLYVAGDAPNSTAARANLGRLLGGQAPGSYDVEVVDCLANPLRAIEEGVLVTPTLLRVSPPPRCTIVGSLSVAANVRSALGLVSSTGEPGDS